MIYMEKSEVKLSQKLLFLYMRFSRLTPVSDWSQDINIDLSIDTCTNLDKSSGVNPTILYNSMDTCTNLDKSFGVNPNILYNSTVDGVFGLPDGAGEKTGVDGNKRVPSPLIYTKDYQHFITD